MYPVHPTARHNPLSQSAMACTYHHHYHIHIHDPYHHCLPPPPGISNGSLFGMHPSVQPATNITLTATMLYIAPSPMLQPVTLQKDSDLRNMNVSD